MPRALAVNPEQADVAVAVAVAARGPVPAPTVEAPVAVGAATGAAPVAPPAAAWLDWLFVTPPTGAFARTPAEAPPPECSRTGIVASTTRPTSSAAPAAPSTRSPTGPSRSHSRNCRNGATRTPRVRP